MKKKTKFRPGIYMTGVGLAFYFGEVEPGIHVFHDGDHHGCTWEQCDDPECDCAPKYVASNANVREVIEQTREEAFKGYRNQKEQGGLKPSLPSSLAELLAMLPGAAQVSVLDLSSLMEGEAKGSDNPAWRHEDISD